MFCFMGGFFKKEVCDSIDEKKFVMPKCKKPDLRGQRQGAKPRLVATSSRTRLPSCHPHGPVTRACLDAAHTQGLMTFLKASDFTMPDRLAWILVTRWPGGMAVSLISSRHRYLPVTPIHPFARWALGMGAAQAPFF